MSKKIAVIAARFNISLTPEKAEIIKDALACFFNGIKILTLSEQIDLAEEEAEDLAFIVAALIRGKVLVLSGSRDYMQAKIRRLQGLHFNASLYDPEKISSNKFLFSYVGNFKNIDFMPFRLIVLNNAITYSLQGKTLQASLNRALKLAGIPCLHFFNKYKALPNNYLALKELPNIPTFRSYIISYCAKRLEEGRSGVIWCKNKKQIDLVAQWLEQTEISFSLCTAEDQLTALDSKTPSVIVATSALLYADSRGFGWSFCNLLPAGSEYLAKIIRVTAGPVTIAYYSQYIDKLTRNEHGTLTEELACLPRTGCLRAALNDLLQINEPLERCLNCSNCYKADPAACISAALTKWRTSQAEKEQLPPCFVLTEEQIALIADKRPQSIKALKALKGLKETKAAKYGASILRTIKSFEG